MEKAQKFALIGAAGFVAPRHLKAIHDTGNELIAAFDPQDSVGILDNYFPKTDFFIEFERFDRHLDKLRRQDQGIDFLTVCSPNYLHDAHIRFGLRQHSDVICEKPLVLNPKNLLGLQEVEKEYGKKIFSILQLRLHPSILKLKKHVEDHPDEVFDIDLTYITARGNWYYTSWKADISKSGGVATNIGIHFFDALAWIFGKPTISRVHLRTHDRAAGFLVMKNARIRWFLSINEDHLPENIKEKGNRTFRSLTLNNEEIEFSEGFNELHTRSYEAIIKGYGFGIEETETSIEMASDIRNQELSIMSGQDYHPFAKFPLSKHPFNY